MAKRFFFCAVAIAFAAACGSSTSSDGAGDGNTGGDDAGGSGSADDGGSGSSSDGGTSSDSGSGGIAPTTDVSIIVEPNGNHASELVDAINGATTSVYMTMYQIDNSSIIDAIKAQESAGHDVKIVLDGSSTNKSFNTPAYDAFNSIHAGTAVWSSTAFTYTHEKCVIVDGKEAWIMTMNLNQSSPNDDREYLAVDTDAADVTEATSVFQADFASSSITPSGNLVVANTNARADLVALIGTATSTLDMELEEFSDMNKGGVVDAVVAAAHAGVKVRIVIANNSPDADQPTAIADVKAAGGSVAMFGGTSSGGTPTHPYVAAKTILVDCGTGTCKSGYVGSENMTAASLGYNRELGVIFSKASELAKIYSTVDADFKAGTPQ